MNDLEQAYLRHDEPTRSCLFALRELIIGMNPDVRTSLSYGMSTFYVGKQRFCYLWVDKSDGRPYIGFIDGNRMNHPRLETGERSRMSIFRIDPEADLEVSEIQGLLHEAIRIAAEPRSKQKR